MVKPTAQLKEFITQLKDRSKDYRDYLSSINANFTSDEKYRG